MKDFKDKVAVITGAASGIGLGIAKRAVKEGMKVVITDIEEEALASAEKELKILGGTVLSVVTDVSKAEDIEALAQRTIDKFGEVHLLCNNAGVGVPGLLWECSLSDWQWIMGVNLWGVIHGIRTFIPIMLKQDNECHVVNTSSMAGLAPGLLEGIYNITKFGVVALSETLVTELANSKIKVSVLCPGFVKTKIIECERNRPEELCDREINLEAPFDYFLKNHPQYKEYAKWFTGMVEKGLSAEKVGDIVFNAIKDDSFYILTDTSLFWKRMVKVRMNGILEAFKQNKQYIQEVLEV